MEDIEFSWDARKARQNLQKHKVSFEEAVTVFYDEYAIEFFDPEHPAEVDLFLMLGASGRLRIMFGSYCFRRKGSEIRIISARKAAKKEEKAYIEGKK